jgi:hypothetical protein
MDMARRRVDLRLDENFLARVDAEAERLGQTRTKFIERALEKALGPPPLDPAAGLTVETRRGAASPAQPSAPSRASANAKPTTEHELQGLRNIYESLVPAVATGVQVDGYREMADEDRALAEHDMAAGYETLVEPTAREAIERADIQALALERHRERSAPKKKPAAGELPSIAPRHWGA